MIIFPGNMDKAPGIVRSAPFPASSVRVLDPTKVTDSTEILPSTSPDATVYPPVTVFPTAALKVPVPLFTTTGLFTPTLIVPVPVNVNGSSAAPPAEPFLNNSVIGIVLSFLEHKKVSNRSLKLKMILEAIQQKLFDMGSELATFPGDEYKGQINLQSEDVEWLEEIIDAMNDELEPLNSFILPGGTPLNSFLHQARTVCRRAEREVIKLNQVDLVNPEIIKYLNRLSDFLFVSGRWVAETLGEKETLWEPGKNRPDWNWK